MDVGWRFEKNRSNWSISRAIGVHKGSCNWNTDRISIWQSYQTIDKMNKELLKLVYNKQTRQMKEKLYKLEQVVLICKA